jgi:large-conductance mechanosensitive channel
MAHGGISYSNVFFEIIGFWLIIILVIFLLIKGILKGNNQKRNNKVIELEARVERLEKIIEKNNE